MSKPRILIPITIQFSVRYLLRSGLLAQLVEDAQPVVLLGQSKGPLDIHAALALYPEIAANVRAFVSVQAPFAGTPLAERRSVLRRLAPEAYFEMSYEQRRDFLRAHPGCSWRGGSV